MHRRFWKVFLLLGAVIIGSSTLLYTYRLTGELKEEERKKVELWHEATTQMSGADNGDVSMALILKVISQNTTIPIIIADEAGQVTQHRNLKLSSKDSVKQVMQKLEKMRLSRDPIVVDLGDEKQYLYYDDSYLIKELSWFPIIQLLLVSLFILIAYSVFSASRKAEQDQVWVGMSKETAHQLGTPTSSMLGWVDLLRLRDDNSEIADELSKDVERLQVITDRFSKIGSMPELKMQPLLPIVDEIVEYLSKRTPKNVTIRVSVEGVNSLETKVNEVLFQWVLENICKNAVDAIKGEGQIDILMRETIDTIEIDIKDTGKGMARKQFKTIFRPGYTTKQRGWGLGLSLAHRIIVDYHKGKIFVKESELGKGTTFRIAIPKH